MPNGLSDGAIVIDTGLDNKGFIRDARQFKRAVETLTQAVKTSGQQMAGGMDSYLKALGKAGSAAKAATGEQAALQKEIDKTAAAIKRMEERQEIARRKFEAGRDEAIAKATDKVGPFKGAEDYDLPFGNPETIEEWQERVSEAVNKAVEDYGTFEESAAFRNSSVDIEYAKEKLAELQAQMDELAGDAAPAAQGMAGGFANVAATARRALGVVGRFAGHAAIGFLKRLAVGAKNAAIQLAKLAGSAISGGMKKLGGFIGRAARSMLGLKKAGAGAESGFGALLKRLLSLGAIIALLKKAFNVAKEGMDALAKSNPAVKGAVDSLRASLNGLKGSLATAFAPILTAAAPALTTLINMLTAAINAIGAFMAALTGQKTYQRAVSGLKATGGAASGAAGSVKKLNRELAGFDELNILGKTDASGGGGGGGGGAGSAYSYETEEIASGITDFVQKLKDLWAAADYEGIGRAIAGAINGAFAKARQLISWDALGDKITQAVDAITGIFNGLVDGIDWAGIGETLAEGLNTITNTLLLWYEGIDWLSIGTAIGEALNGMIERVNWPNLGKLVSEKAHSLILTLKGAITTIQWGDAATKFASAVNAFFKNKNLFKDAGDTIDAALKGLLDFTGRFIIEFDEVEAAKSIREALGRIQWGQIARNFWDGAKLAFKKAGNFLKVLLGGDVYDVQSDAVEQMWERGSGNASSMSYAQSWAANLGKAVGNALGRIPWGEIFKTVLKAASEAVTGFVDGLFGTKDGVFLAKFVLGIAAAKIVITALIGGLSHSLVGAIGLLGVAVVAAAVAVWEKLKSILDKIDQARKESVENAAKAFEKSYEKDPEATITAYEAAGYKNLRGTTNTKAEAVARVRKIQEYLVKGKTIDEANQKTDAYFSGEHTYGEDPLMLARAEKYARENTDALKNNTKVTEESRKAFEEAGGDLKGWDDLYTTSSNRAAFKAAGGDLKGWDALFGGEQTVDVGVNYTPKGQGGASFINNPMGWLRKTFAPGADAQTRVALVRDGFNTVAEWVGRFSGGGVTKGIGVTTAGWTSIAAWIIGSLMGGGVTKGVGVTQSGWTNIAAWIIGGLLGGGVTKGVGVTQSGWKNVGSWITGSLMGGGVDKGIGLVKSAWTTVQKFVQDSMGGVVEQKVKLVKEKNNTLTWTVSQSKAAGGQVVMMAKAMGGIITAAGRSLAFASGGMLRGGHASLWNGVQKYAGGTSRAHGSLFVAGEAGPEIIGHVNGRTEILNQSQLAQTMQSAVASGMLAALSRVQIKMPAMATGGVMPYEVSAQIAKSTADIQGTLNANNEDLIQTIISVAGQLVAALNRQNSPQPAGAGGLTAQQVINEINRQTLMFGASPLKGV